jgi:DNA-binding response OmpR family regulator
MDATGGAGYVGPVPDVLLAADAPWVVDEVRAALSGPQDNVRVVTTGEAVRGAVAEQPPDLVVLDLQIGNMGAMAACMDLRLEESGGRIDRVPVLLLLDRRPDVFLARRTDADGWLIKPISPVRLRKAARALLAGERFEDATQRPPTVAVAPTAAPSPN